MKPWIWALLLFLFPLGSMAQYGERAQRTPIFPTRYLQAKKEGKMKIWCDSVFDSMTLDQRIGQLFVVGAEIKLTDKNKEALSKLVEEYKVGGIIFSKGSAKEQAELTNYCQSRASTPLFITLDGEWGLSMRLSQTPRFPMNMPLGAVSNDSLLYLYGKEVGRECRRMGIQVNFAPALDVNNNALNPVIGLRSFGEEANQVSRKGIAYARGLESEGIISVAKHFPGHGDTQDDSHFTLPSVKASLARLDSVELLPFQRYIDAGLSGMLLAHLSVPALDSATGRPTSLSPLVVINLLREKMGFNGLVFTDALEMKGAGASDQLSVDALLAGNDVLLKPLQPERQIEQMRKAVLNDWVPMSLIEEKCYKILEYKYLSGLNVYAPVSLSGLSEDLNTVESTLLNRALNKQSLTLVENRAGEIPLKHLAKRKIAALSIGATADNTWTRTLSLYAPIESYALSEKSTPAEIEKVIKQLKPYNTLLVGAFSSRSGNIALAREVNQKLHPIFTLFTSPYVWANIADSIPPQALLMAYESTSLAQEQAAQLLFGGIAAEGKLPVSVADTYPQGSGETTPVTRLAYGTPEEAGIDSKILSEIDTIVQKAIAERVFPGCQILVARKGKVVYQQAFGNQDYTSGQKVSNTTLYDLASVTKAIATLPAVMQLYDRGEISLNQSVAHYLPKLTAANKQQITIKECLFHETGLPGGLSIAGIVSDGKGGLKKNYVSQEPSSTYLLPIANRLYGNEALADTLFNYINRSKVNPSKPYLYSCLNFELLRNVVEEITQEGINIYLQEGLYKELGIDRMCYLPLTRYPAREIAPTEDDETLRKQLLRGYVHDEMAAFQGGIGGNAGLFGTTNEIAKLLQMVLNGGNYGGEELLKPTTVEKFLTATTTKSRRGLGWDRPNVEEPKKSSACKQASAQTVGHTGFTGTCFWIDPEQELIYIFLSNRVHPDRKNNKLSTQDIRSQIQGVIYIAIKNNTKFT